VNRTLHRRGKRGAWGGTSMHGYQHVRSALCEDDDARLL
jgi:hypothetical protein